jgi:ferredoxin
LTIRVSVDRDVCIGSGNCVRLARHAFGLDEHQLAVILDAQSVTIEQLRLAERSCPTGAITVTEDNAKERID